VQKKIDEAMNDPEHKAKLQKARAELNELKTSKQSLINEKKALRAQLDSARNKTDKIIKDKKDARSNVKFSSLEEINKEISKLQRQQETTTMSLTEEKRLIKEIDALEASKKFVQDLKSKDAAMDDVKEERKTIAQQMAAKDKEIDAFNAKMDAVMETIRALNDVETKKRDSLQGLFKQRDDKKKLIGEKLKIKDKLRDDFREKNNAWYNYQRAVRAQKKIQYEEEKKKRDEERQAYQAKLEEEEAKKIPYEAEQALCDYLADYLERTYLKGKSEGGDGDSAEKKVDVVEVKDDPFAGFKPVTKKDDDAYFASAASTGGKKAKKKRGREAKKQQDTTAGPFKLSVDTFEQFGLISMSPPTSVEQVPKVVKDLREKKEWYKQQPRGSVPTALEIRKANEKAAAKLRQQNEGSNGADGGGGGGASKPKKQSGGFSLDNDDFAPLGSGGGGGGVNASWGQKPPAAAAAAAAEAEPEA